MSQTFKTQAEIYQALLDGKKIKHVLWGADFVHLVGGTMLHSNGADARLYLNIPNDWLICEEPKQPRKALAFVSGAGTIERGLEGSLAVDLFEKHGWKRAPGFDIEEKL